jgi:hypothetical protein
MNITKQVLIFAFIAATVIAVMATPINPTATTSTQQNQGAMNRIRTWEYCAITNAFTVEDSFGLRGKAVIRYFRYGGVREETVEFAPGIAEKNIDLRDDALAKAMAKLGAERWEMVSKEPNTDGKFKPFYFKRSNQ